MIIVPEPKKIVSGDETVNFSGLTLAGCELPEHSFEKLSPYISEDGLPLHVKIDTDMSGESYVLNIGEECISVVGGSDRGVYYAILTLVQILRQYESVLPVVRVEDAPDFKIRGFMYDVSRGKVPTLETLKFLADYLSDLKVNMLQLYVEGRAFYYPSLNKYYSAPDDYLTAEDVKNLSDYCKERFIDLVPCGNSYGHMTYWLNQKEFKSLAYSPDGFDWSKGGLHCPAGTLDPTNPDSEKFVKGLFDEMLPSFGDAQLFNIGGDEPFDTLYGDKKLDDDGETYFNYIGKICEDVRSRGLTPMMWGDVAHHHPDKMDRLGDVVFLEWRYDAGLFNDESCQVYADNNKRFCVCPSSSLCNNFTGKTDNTLANIREGAYYGKKYGAEGLINTEWGDGSYAQTQTISYYPAGIGACYAWNAEEFSDDNLKVVLDRDLYHAHVADIVADLGRYINLQTQPVHMIPYLFSALYIRGLDCMQVDYDNYSDPTAYFRRDELLNEEECLAVEKFLDELKSRIDSVEEGIYHRELKFSWSLLKWALMHTRICRSIRNNNPDVALIEEAYDFGTKCVTEQKKLWKIRNKKSDYDLASFRYRRLVKNYRRFLIDLTTEK